MPKRSAADYGLYDLPDETLQLLASDARRYGEKSRFAGQELSARQGLMGDANTYRAALEKAAYGDFGRQYSAGLGDITNYLARSGPLADSGAATALRARLASQLYGQAQSRIGSSYADYLRAIQQQRRGFNYQRALLQYQQNLQNQNKGGFWGTVGGIVGSAVPFLPGVGGSKAASSTSWSQTPWGS